MLPADVRAPCRPASDRARIMGEEEANNSRAKRWSATCFDARPAEAEEDSGVESGFLRACTPGHAS